MLSDARDGDDDDDDDVVLGGWGVARSLDSIVQLRRPASIPSHS